MLWIRSFYILVLNYFMNKRGSLGWWILMIGIQFLEEKWNKIRNIFYILVRKMHLFAQNKASRKIKKQFCNPGSIYFFSCIMKNSSSVNQRTDFDDENFDETSRKDIWVVAYFCVYITYIITIPLVVFHLMQDKLRQVKALLGLKLLFIKAIR